MRGHHSVPPSRIEGRAAIGDSLGQEVAKSCWCMGVHLTMPEERGDRDILDSEVPGVREESHISRVAATTLAIRFNDAFDAHWGEMAPSRGLRFAIFTWPAFQGSEFMPGLRMG